MKKIIQACLGMSVLLTLVGVSCTSTATPTNTSNLITPTNTEVVNIPNQNTNGKLQPLNQPTHVDPGERDLMIASSSDGEQFGTASVFEEAAGVPSVIRTNDNRLVAAFQAFPEDLIAAKISTDDGATWSDRTLIEIEGLPSGYTRAFDPTVTLTPDGRIRLYFTSEPNGSRMFETTTAIYSAIGDDGVHYTFEPGIRFSSDEAVYDVAGIYFNNQWLLTAPDGPADNGARWATSSDGLNFTQADENIPSVGNVNWTGNLLLFGDGLRFYGGASPSNGTWWADSADGVTWTDPVRLGFDGFDPAVVQTSAQDYLIIYVQ